MRFTRSWRTLLHIYIFKALYCLNSGVGGFGSDVVVVVMVDIVKLICRTHPDSTNDIRPSDAFISYGKHQTSQTSSPFFLLF